MGFHIEIYSPTGLFRSGHCFFSSAFLWAFPKQILTDQTAVYQPPMRHGQFLSSSHPISLGSSCPFFPCFKRHHAVSFPFSFWRTASAPYAFAYCRIARLRRFLFPVAMPRMLALSLGVIDHWRIIVQLSERMSPRSWLFRQRHKVAHELHRCGILIWHGDDAGRSCFASRPR